MFARVDKEIGEKMEKAIKDLNSKPDHSKAPYGKMEPSGGGY
jgi:hypothetical protein